MALIDQLPSESVIGSLRGILDYYVWCNLNIVRTWPRSPGRTRSLPCALVGQQFSYINKEASTITPDLFTLYQDLAGGTSLSWKDFLVRLYVNGDFHLQETGPA